MLETTWIGSLIAQGSGGWLGVGPGGLWVWIWQTLCVSLIQQRGACILHQYCSGGLCQPSNTSRSWSVACCAAAMHALNACLWCLAETQSRWHLNKEVAGSLTIKFCTLLCKVKSPIQDFISHAVYYVEASRFTAAPSSICVVMCREATGLQPGAVPAAERGAQPGHHCGYSLHAHSHSQGLPEAHMKEFSENRVSEA